MKIIKTLGRIIKITAAIFVSGILAVVFLFFYFAQDLPDLSKIDEKDLIESTKIYDRDGKIILYDIFSDIKRTSLAAEDIPQKIIDATIAIEDEKFFTHKGFSIKSVVRAIIFNLASQKISQGGSTITQQLIKNSFLTPEKTFQRKIKEVILAYEMERRYSKKEIITAYLNTVSYGSGAYGIEAASQTFFAKTSKELSLAEGAILAALPKAPSYFSPYGLHKDELISRRNFILDKMSNLGFISSNEAMLAKKEIVKFTPVKSSIKAPHFVIYVREYLIDKYGEEFIQKSGLKITSSLDYELQKIAEDVVKRAVEKNEKDFKAKNASLVAIDPKTGQILAMVGSRDYFNLDYEGNFNVAVSGRRQPGSAFKPFVYALALKKGYPPDTVLFDLPTEFNPLCELGKGPIIQTIDESKCYHPENFNEKYLGPVTLKQSIAQSINIPSVKLLYLVGVEEAIKFAESLGITTLKDRSLYGLSLVLGGGEVKLLELVSAYGVFANDGIKNDPVSILKIEDKNGNILEEYKPHKQQVLDKQIARILNNILSDNDLRTPAFGPTSALYIPDYSVAVKTGTSNDYRDLWTIGYSPNLVAGIWVGNNDYSPINKKTVSSQVAAPWWNEFMRKALARLPKENFNLPEEIAVVDKPMLNGQFINEKTFKIDKVSKKLITDLTPLEFIEEIKFQEVHSILYFVDKNNPLGPKLDNPSNDPQFKSWEESVSKWLNDPKRKEEGLNLTIGSPPTEYDDIHTLDNKPTVTIIKPISNTSISKNSMTEIEIIAQGKFKIKQADFFIDDIYLGSRNISPYLFTFRVPNDLQGEHRLGVKVYDEYGNFNQAEMKVMIE